MRPVSLLLLVIISVLQCSSYASLLHVNLLYRHGDRSPGIIYPKDINGLDKWPDGLGWLSKIGKQQQYELGQYLQQKYDGFVNVTRYDHRQIAIQSSGVERCLMSAYSNLAGFFPPEGDQVWNKILLWQPIPVLTLPPLQDNKLAMQAPCPRYDQLTMEVLQSKKVQDYQAKNKAFFKNVSINTGMTEDLINIWHVADTLFCEHAHNMTWNEWVYEPGVYDKLEALPHFVWHLLFLTPEMTKLKGGPLLKEMIDNMKAASLNSSSQPKIHMYSAHDITVAGLLHAMNVFNNQQPPYRTLVIVELHKIDGDDTVKVLYRNDTSKDPYEFPVPGCGDPCLLSKFESLLKNHIPTDWKAECKAHTSSSTSLSLACFDENGDDSVQECDLDVSGLPSSATSWIALGIGCTVVVIFIIGLVILCRRKGHFYSKL